uniref:Chromo domain-containing protein n=1 Tax=Ascaris lumbricoides TaxID=6252 RepID=A0A0M3IB15_ASCLU
MFPFLKSRRHIVEKVIDKRVRNGVVEYFVSWKGLPPSENMWEPKNNLDCPELIQECPFLQAFETRRRIKSRKNKLFENDTCNGFERVAQLRRSHGGRLRLQSLLSPKAHARLSETEGTVAVLKSVFKDFKQAKLHGLEPEGILGAMRSENGEVTMLIKWKGREEAELVPAKLANEQCPQLVIQFHEEHFQLNSCIGI